jgi:hypothetical protein
MQSGRVPAQSGHVPAQGPPRGGQFPQPQFPVRQQRNRRKILLPALAAVVVAGVVVGVVLATRGGHKSDNAGKPKTSDSSAVTSAPTATQPPSTTPSTNPARSSSPPTNFDKYFSDPNVRAYMRPSYKLIDSCDAERDGVTFCQLNDGLTIGMGSNVAAGRNQTIRGGVLVNAPSTSWQQKVWQRGGGSGRLRTWLNKDQADVPRLYWDRNNTVYGILAIGAQSVTTTNAAALRRTWQNNFER